MAGMRPLLIQNIVSSMSMTAQVNSDVEVAAAHASEVSAGERFQFGQNWKRFLESVDEVRIQEAVASLKHMLGVHELDGRTFLDIGSGSGLFSLAAYRLGATVTSFDYDTDSVGCTLEMRRRFAGEDSHTRWSIFQGSVLDEAMLSTLGVFDVVYSWGVLHHTGQMWKAIENAKALVDLRGTFFIAIYNDQGAWSQRWTKIKRFYCSGAVGRWIVSTSFISFWVARNFIADLVWLRNPFAHYLQYGRNRGMTVYSDWHDWLGGYPFEVAKPEEIILYLAKYDFRLTNLVTAGGSVGCVEYVFHRV
jgi:2-polyprenyl-3-methyl-5-hydroxy-6-metoxy-1,4-benzoquinol methylase